MYLTADLPNALNGGEMKSKNGEALMLSSGKQGRKVLVRQLCEVSNQQCFSGCSRAPCAAMFLLGHSTVRPPAA
ncbi:uncharacterized [Tachysurus ichikawai]